MTHKRHNPVDALQRRCPRLGSMIRFYYCRTVEQEGLPCYKIFDCWWEQFDVVKHLQSCLSQKDLQRLSTRRPPDKVNSLLALIHQARQRIEDRENRSEETS